MKEAVSIVFLLSCTLNFLCYSVQSLLIDQRSSQVLINSWPLRNSLKSRDSKSLLVSLTACFAKKKDSTVIEKVPSEKAKPQALSIEQSAESLAEEKAYGADSITVLKGLDPVRKRPGMYIGSTSQRGLHHLIFEIVDNSVDESLAGHCSVITISMESDGSIEVTDNGRGIPCNVHPSTGKSTLETVMCVLHAGGKFGGEESGYKVSGGLHGVGLSVVNALSEKLTAEVVRGSTYHSLSCERGVPVSDLFSRPTEAGDIPRGTRVTFRPDPQIFKSTVEFDFDKVALRMDELAYLNAGLSIQMRDFRKPVATGAAAAAMKAAADLATKPEALPEEDSAKGKKKKPKKADGKGKEDKAVSQSGDGDDSAPPMQVVFDAAGDAFRAVTYRHDGGIQELVKVLCEGKINLHSQADVIYFREEKNNIVVEVAMRWSKDMYIESLSGFANGIRTADGGAHIDGLKFAISKVVNTLAKKAGKVRDSSIPGEFIREGLTAVISVKVPEPEFEGQTKTRLGNPEVRQAVDAVVGEKLLTFFEWNPQALSEVCTKAFEAQSAAVAAKAAREMVITAVRRKSLLQSAVLPGKLSDCASRNPVESEIYLVEGDSAAGSAKLGRDRNFQAILPLKGKILNIEKASNEKIYQNSELQALISALGLGVRGVEFDPQLLRYHRIIIMCDADVDGAHIRLLILTFLYRYQKELFEKGFIYIACPPLYKVSPKSGSKKSEHYFYSQEEIDAHMRSLAPSFDKASLNIQRFKGLGEMMPMQLWETTMDPARRMCKVVTVEDAAAADRLFSVLMGDNVQPRKEFIISNVDGLKLSDLDY